MYNRTAKTYIAPMLCEEVLDTMFIMASSKYNDGSISESEWNDMGEF